MLCSSFILKCPPWDINNPQLSSIIHAYPPLSTDIQISWIMRTLFCFQCPIHQNKGKITGHNNQAHLLKYMVVPRSNASFFNPLPPEISTDFQEIGSFLEPLRLTWCNFLQKTSWRLLLLQIEALVF